MKSERLLQNRLAIKSEMEQDFVMKNMQAAFIKVGLITRPNWQCCLAGSSKTAPRILFFSVVLGAEYSFYVKSIATYAPLKVDIMIHS